MKHILVRLALAATLALALAIAGFSGTPAHAAGGGNSIPAQICHTDAPLAQYIAANEGNPNASADAAAGQCTAFFAQNRQNISVVLNTLFAYCDSVGFSDPLCAIIFPCSGAC